MSLDADPYRTLGLTRGATLVEVKRAYRRLAKVNHPDAAGPATLPRFLAIQAAYEQLAGGAANPAPAGRTARPSPARPSAADPARSDATRRAYGGRAGAARPASGQAGADSGPARSRGPAADPGRGRGPTDAEGGPASPGRRPRDGGAGTEGSTRGATDDPRRDPSDRPGGAPDPGAPREPATRHGKATLGSTSYDGADAGPFEPDWGGASWYGTTSGTYWTINPKEYADPRKHGPEYQARARRSARPGSVGPAAPGRAGDDPPDPAADPTHTTSSWWESTSGPAAERSGPEPVVRHPGSQPRPAPDRGPRGRTGSVRRDEPAPDPSRAALDLGRGLTDPRSGALRGRVLRALLGWLPLAFGLGWFVGELSGCGRFAATCDPSVGPLTAVGQGTILVALLLLPEIAALTAGAALILLVAAVAGGLLLSATGGAADVAASQEVLGALLLVAWLCGLTIALVRRVRSGPRTAGPVS